MQGIQATNRLEEAEPLIRRALAIDKASYGSEHLNTQLVRISWRRLLKALGQTTADMDTLQAKTPPSSHTR